MPSPTSQPPSSSPFSSAGVSPAVARPRFAAVILAAGGSSRLGGAPKQLLAFRGRPLVVRAAEAALASEAWPVVVVLGARAAEIRPHLAALPLQIVENAAWEEGMASSLRAGLDVAERFSRTLDGVLFALCDQPHFSAETIGRLGARWTGAGGLTAARYGGATGVPALFGRAWFAQLKALSGAEGARRILAERAAEVVAVDSPELAIDVDTAADYQSLLDSEPRP